MQLYSLKFSFEIICQRKVMCNFFSHLIYFEIQILQMTSDEEMTKTTVVGLKKLKNLVVYIFYLNLFWVLNTNFKLYEHKMARTNIRNRFGCLMDVVVRG